MTQLTNEFSEMKVGMGISSFPVNQEKIEQAVVRPEIQGQEIKAVSPTTTPITLSAGTGRMAGDNISTQYKGEFGPKGDMNYACTSLTDNLKEAMTGLFGALGSKADEPAVTPENNPQLALAQPAPQQNFRMPFGM